jgi:hypothetical protein
MVTTDLHSNGDVALSLGDHLRGYCWDHFATLTYRHPRTLERVRHDVVRTWIRNCERVAQTRIRWAYVIELTHAEHYHAHVLLHGSVALTTEKMAKAWRYGRTDVQLYDSRRGAAHYLAKAVGDERVWWDVSKRPPPRIPT